MLALDTEKTKVKNSDQFLVVMEEAEPVEEVGLSESTMVLLTRAGQLFVLGGESRVPTKLNLSSPGRPVLVATSSAYLFVAMEEGPVIQVKWDGKAEQEQMIPWSELSSRVRRAVTLITCREITVALLCYPSLSPSLQPLVGGGAVFDGHLELG